MSLHGPNFPNVWSLAIPGGFLYMDNGTLATLYVVREDGGERLLQLNHKEGLLRERWYYKHYMAYIPSSIGTIRVNIYVLSPWPFWVTDKTDEFGKWQQTDIFM